MQIFCNLFPAGNPSLKLLHVHVIIGMILSAIP